MLLSLVMLYVVEDRGSQFTNHVSQRLNKIFVSNAEF